MQAINRSRIIARLRKNSIPSKKWNEKGVHQNSSESLRWDFSTLPDLQFKFSFDGDSRGNHQLILINNTNVTQKLKTMVFRCNADIENPWQELQQYWESVTRLQVGNEYVYTLTLAKEIDIKPGENTLLEYSVSKALGPISNVAMPPREVSVNGQELSNFYCNDPQVNPNENFEVNMYHANWGQYNSYKRTMKDEYWADINCLTYASGGFDSSGAIFSRDNWADQLELILLAIAKQNKPYLNTSISFGGWTNGGVRMDSVFSALVRDPDSRRKFVVNAVSAALQTGINGIDIDWEYVAQADAQNFVSLLQELRAEMTSRMPAIPKPRLTIAAPASMQNIEVFTAQQWKDISNTVDKISVMNYDYYGAFSTYADFLAPTKISPDSPDYQGGKGECIANSILAYQNMGVDLKKLTMGIPNYARGVIVAAPKPGEEINSNDIPRGLYQKVITGAPGDSGEGDSIYSWDNIYKFLNKQPSTLDKLGLKNCLLYDSSNNNHCKEAQMSMISGELADGNVFVLTYLSQEDAKLRGEYIKQAGLGGAMFWANYTETKDPATSIVAAVSDSLSGSKQNKVSNPSAPSLELMGIEPPSYEETCGVQPPPSYEAVMREKLIEKQLDIITYFSIHMANLKDRLLFGNEKNTMMLELLSFKDNVPKMQRYFEWNKKKLSQHRNIFKRAATTLLGEDIGCRLFNKPKSLEYAEELLKISQKVELSSRS